MTPVKGAKLTRREQAVESRQKVLQAAREVFVEAGYHGATMAQIAERSGLAVQTVSYHFGTKAKLLSELITASVARLMGESEPLSEADWQADVSRVKSSEELVASMVDAGHEAMLGIAQLMDVARIGAMTDPEVAEVFDFHENWRISDFGRAAKFLAELGAVRDGVDAEIAADILVTIFSPDTYRVLLIDRGWPAERIKAWMLDTLGRLLLP